MRRGRYALGLAGSAMVIVATAMVAFPAGTARAQAAGAPAFDAK